MTAQQPGASAVMEQFLGRVDSLRQALRIPGLAIAVLRDTTVLAARGYGYANLRTRTPVTPETPFNIASVTKPISAVVALALVERSLLDLDRPMQRYAGFISFCSDVRQAGGMFFSDFQCESDRLTLRHVLSMTANGTPGTRFWYNPPVYSWGSRPIAEVAGRSFSDLTVELVFRPAGMTRSARIHRRLPLRADLVSELARPYRADSTGGWTEAPEPGPQGDGAAGGVISTATDLARFDIALMQNRLISESSRQLLWRSGQAPDGTRLPYGLGWFLGELKGEPVAWHTGLWEGAYSALYLKLLRRGYTLILLANGDALQWPTRFDEAAIERSPFAQAFVAATDR